MKVYRALQDGRIVRLSPEPMGTDDFPDAVSFDEVEQEVPSLEGTIRFWDDDDGIQHPHLHYVCPRCSLEHNVDLYAGDSNPRFACCDTCGWSSILWISWSTPHTAYQSSGKQSDPMDARNPVIQG